MTTLPQNAPMRIPRPPVSMSGGGGAGPTPGGMSGADALRVLRGNLPLILVLVVVATGVGFAVNYYLAKYYSRYTATGLCEISLPVSASIFNRGQASLSEVATATEQRTQVQGMLQEALFSKVLQNANSAIRTTQWFKSFESPSLARQDLVKNFSAVAIADTRLIKVAMQYRIPDDAKIITQEVVDEHLRSQISIAQNRNFDKTQQLNTMKVRLEADLRAVQQDRKEQSAKLAQAGYPATGMGGFSPKLAEIESAAKNYIEVQEKMALGKSQLEQINSAMNAGQDPPMLMRAVENDDDYKRLQAGIRELDMGIKTNEKYGSESPQMKDMKRRMDLFNAQATEMKKSLMAKLKVTVVEDLQGQVKSLEQSAKDASQRLEALKAEAGEIANVTAQFQASTIRETNISQSLRDVQDSLDQQAIINNASSGASIGWYVKPITPEIPSFPKLSVTLTMSITLGLLLGLAIAFLRELLNTTIRSPRDVAKIGSIAVLGMVPHEDDDPQSAGARLPLVIAEAPQSMTAEQFRQIRTRLQHASSLDTTRSLMITSANPGDGKTTIAANMAAGLALVGRRILLVDGNFRRPELHKLFGLDNTGGFSNVLAEPDKMASLVKATKIPNLSVLPSGPKPANATEMLESTLLTDFIEKALENYDHVIFDSGPILFASETVAMAPRVDGVVTVVRAHQSTRGVLARVKDTLRQIKAENLGVVINGIRSYGGGYYGRNIKTYYEYAANGN